MKILYNMPVSVKEEKVLRRLGRRGSEQNNRAFYDLFREEYKSALSTGKIDAIIEKMMIIKRDTITVKAHNIPVEKEIPICISIKSRDLSKLLDGCQEVYIFAVTAGEEISRRIRDLSERGDNSRALITDAVGSELVEAAADEINRYISKQTSGSLTRRFSPGYGDWGVENQNEIDRILDLKQIGIKLNESFLMIPEKSITALVGVKKDLKNE